MSVNCELFLECTTLVIAIAAFVLSYVEYTKHKKRTRIEILCRYNERYQSDHELSKVVRYLEKIENPLKEGEKNEQPDRHSVEMYMRFYEELYFLIKANSIKKEIVYYMFGHYVLVFEEHFTHLADWENQLGYQEEYWKVFRQFVNLMKEEKKSGLNKIYNM
ncbi:MAG: hypothetical protein IKJ08_05480 [Alistipes sp.]|nr:hypothetical protein [Alistipes sp.]